MVETCLVILEASSVVLLSKSKQDEAIFF